MVDRRHHAHVNAFFGSPDRNRHVQVDAVDIHNAFSLRAFQSVHQDVFRFLVDLFKFLIGIGIEQQFHRFAIRFRNIVRLGKRHRCEPHRGDLDLVVQIDQLYAVRVDLIRPVLRIVPEYEVFLVRRAVNDRAFGRERGRLRLSDFFRFGQGCLLALSKERSALLSKCRFRFGKLLCYRILNQFCHFSAGSRCHQQERREHKRYPFFHLLFSFFGMIASYHGMKRSSSLKKPQMMGVPVNPL